MTAIYSRTSDAFEARADGIVMLLHVGSGECHELNDVAALVWALLEEPATIDDLVEELRTLVDVDIDECRAAVCELLKDFDQRRLIVRQD